MRKSCAQTGHNIVLSAGITTKINHRAAYKNFKPVYKRLGFTPTRVQTTPSSLWASTQVFARLLQGQANSYTHYAQGLLLTTTSLNVMKI